ncbi:hypothetical protein FLAG1_03776 [Fusarium langsethiae]|uniref:Apple domain-containing protein n=1 Tax=Fusarium langsethiae TaxID=179993 RepID=A0A0N0DFX5_FUSLA|nr:hypothetical protein FLAG1_03776 [Fusarium langsethiae]GKU01621.1 unnamed protein product [Fusarium langsethiae]GKU16155.1 unnamed protein product [Fusarium langsethiae]
MSDSSATTLDQTTPPGSSHSDLTTTIDSTVSSDAIVVDISTFSGSFTTEILDEITTFGDSTITTDTITIPTDTSTSTDASVSTDTTVPADTTGITVSTGSDALYETMVSIELSKSIEQTTTADTVIYTQSTSAEIAETTETIAITETSTSMDVTTTEFTTVSALETASTESLWTSTTAVSCPVYSNVVDDSSFEGENNAPNRWELGGQWAGTAVTYQKHSSTSQEVPRAHSGDQFVLLGTDVGTDMRRVVSLDSKQYQLWITYAAISDPDEDWSFNFVVATSSGHAMLQAINVPKGSPFVYRQESTIFRGRKDDSISVLVRPFAGSKPRLVAIDDIYVAEYVPSCVTPTVKTELCGGIQGVPGNAGQPYRTVNLNQGNEEICAQLCTKDESCDIRLAGGAVFQSLAEEWCSTTGLVGNAPVLTARRLDMTGNLFIYLNCVLVVEMT